jgi:arsenate reductase
MAAVRVLFLCTGNSARSILAEAALKHMGGSDFDVHSAGTAPKGVNPYALQVLAANGIDASYAVSKTVLDFEGQDFDYVITLCDDAAENCPVFWGGTDRLHWGFEDPAAVEGSNVEKLVAFQAVLDGLKTRIEPFMATARSVKEGAI